jgi:hypothetical protein
VREVQAAARRRVLARQRRELGGEPLKAEVDSERLLVLAKELADNFDVVRGGGFANRDGVYFDCSTR